MKRPNEPDSLWFRNSLLQDSRLFEVEGATSVYCLLAFMADEVGLVSTSLEELVEDTAADREILEHAIAHLVALELISQEMIGGADDSELQYRLRVGIDYRRLDESNEQ